MEIQLHRSMRVMGVVVALLLAACQSTTDDSTTSPEVLPTPTTTESASATASATADDDNNGEGASVFELEQGDCFTATGDQVETVTVVGCEDTHIYEVFAVFDHEADEDEAYPGDEAILDYADTQCQPLFEDYVATDYQSSIYWITSVTPSDETWDEGDDREIVCALKLGDEGEETAGSAEGTGE